MREGKRSSIADVIVHSNSYGLRTGDRVCVDGTVTDISESGVETIRLDTDQEGYVNPHRLYSKDGGEDDHS